MAMRKIHYVAVGDGSSVTRSVPLSLGVSHCHKECPYNTRKNIYSHRISRQKVDCHEDEGLEGYIKYAKERRKAQTICIKIYLLAQNVNPIVKMWLMA